MSRLRDNNWCAKNDLVFDDCVGCMFIKTIETASPNQQISHATNSLTYPSLQLLFTSLWPHIIKLDLQWNYKLYIASAGPCGVIAQVKHRIMWLESRGSIHSRDVVR